MLFNSHIFIFFFLPTVVLGIYVLLIYRSPVMRLCLFLLLASWVFYAYWNPHHLPLLIASIGANYFLGSYLARHALWRRCWGARSGAIGLLETSRWRSFS